MKKIAFIYTWPNTPFKNAEYEVLKRVELAAKNIGQKVDIISSNGYLLDSEYYETEQRVVEDNYEFMVSVHYDDIKKLDIFSYYTLWVPPEISLQYSVYPRIKKNIMSNDDYLIYDDGGQSDHLKTILMDSPRQLENCSELYATPPASAVIKPALKDPHLFYCGINWEKLIGAAPRHAGLFNLLEKVDWIDIFGPESTWKGCKRYKGKIPFDGVSMLQEINNSGVVLSISSDVHYRAGSVTNRVYEAAAGGAVIISDTNRFVKQMFGDSVLYFDFDKKNPEHMFNQIKEHMEWIRLHKEEAQKLAERSQQIFIEKLGQEKQLKTLIANHENRKKAVAEALYSKEPEKETLAVAFFDDLEWSDNTEKRLLNTIKNIGRQYEKNITLFLICNENLRTNIDEVLFSAKRKINVKCSYVKFYDDFENKNITRGQSLFTVLNQEKHDYLLLLTGTEYLFKDHITTLKRTLEDEKDASIAYSGFCYEVSPDKFGYVKFEIMPEDFLFDLGRLFPNGTYLLKANIEKYLQKYVYSNLDGAELYALINVAHFKHNEQIAFSKRMTAREQKRIADYSNPALPLSYQKNMVDGINLFELEKLRVNGELTHKSSDRNEHFTKFLQKKYARHVKLVIFFQKIRKLFAFTSKKKQFVKKRIDRLKDELKEIKSINGSRI